MWNRLFLVQKNYCRVSVYMNALKTVMLMNSTAMFYAVVYGDNWEDIEYFSSIHKAKAKLVIHTRFIHC